MQQHGLERQTIDASQQGELLATDYYGPLRKAKGGVRHVLVTIDFFYKFAQLYPVQRSGQAVHTYPVEGEVGKTGHNTSLDFETPPTNQSSGKGEQGIRQIFPGAM